MDELDAGRFSGLYLVLTGTPSFFDGPQGVQRLPPLAQRLHVEFTADSRFDNPRAVQIRLSNFDLDKLEQVGRRVRDSTPRVLTPAIGFAPWPMTPTSRTSPEVLPGTSAARSAWLPGSS
jgi:hypothetical protein